MRCKQIKEGIGMPERDRNRTQTEMKIKSLNHKAVLYFHTKNLDNLNAFLKKNKLSVEEKLQMIM